MRNLLLLFLSLGCTDSSPSVSRSVPIPSAPAWPNDRIGSLLLFPERIGAYVGLPAWLNVRGLTASGDTVLVEGARWASDDPAVVRADSVTGALTVVAPGRANIQVRWQGLQARAELIATRLCRGPGVVLLGPGTITVGETLQWRVQVTPCPTASAQRVVWSTSDSTRLRLSEDGSGTGVSPGEVIVVASLVPDGSASALVVHVVKGGGP